MLNKMAIAFRNKNYPLHEGIEKGFAPEPPPMSHTDHRTLINRGRKAGLSTRELYSAMAARVESTGQGPGQCDGNGFAPGYDQHGRRVYRPAASEPTLDE